MDKIKSLAPFSTKTSLFSISNSNKVSKQSATKAGEQINTFFVSSLEAQQFYLLLQALTISQDQILIGKYARILLPLSLIFQQIAA